MTKQKLKELMLQCIENAQDDYKDEWYCSDRDIMQHALEQFANRYLNIDLKEINK